MSAKADHPREITAAPGIALLAAGIALLAATVLPAAAAAGLERAEVDGYLQWLHSLEQSVAGREKAGLAETGLLFPYGTPLMSAPETTVDHETPERQFMISKALLAQEMDLRLDRSRAHDSALSALALGRNYGYLAEYDSAQVWFKRAGRLDSAGVLTADIDHAALATAILRDDASAVAQAVAELVAGAEPTERAQTWAVALRHLLVSGDDGGLRQLLVDLAAVATAEEVDLPVQLRFWYAFALAYERDWAGSQLQLRRLVRAGSLAGDLDEKQRAWALIAIPDQFYLQGDSAAAREIYGVLAGSNLSEIRHWSTFQLANLDFLAADYLRAGSAFAQLCEEPETGPWSEAACSLVPIARELGRLKTDGKPYGTAAFYRP